MADRQGWTDPAWGGERSRDGEALARGGLKLGHLRMAAALDEHGQVSAAASVLNISQPAASRMIAEIEAIVGAPICERLPCGVALTPYGKALARRAKCGWGRTLAVHRFLFWSNRSRCGARRGCRSVRYCVRPG